ncbi:MAG: hypothetical protein DMG57_13615 [Acidobacteria bacterium]|nr:MAG: hypothetical protein DMG57_13615 [Acidobacteriota bacterium]
MVQHSQILLMAAAHKPDQEIARALGITRQTVALWQERFVEQGVAGIEKDVPRSGRPRTILPPQIDEILRRTTRETPPAATHWSTRTLAQVSQVSFSTVGRSGTLILTKIFQMSFPPCLLTPNFWRHTTVATRRPHE